MATPVRPEPLHNIKSAARKLPIKRKPNASSDPTTPRPPFSIIVDDGEGEVDGDYPSPDSSPDASTPNSVPFKFQRIWSESDEVRFLRGLLSCHSLGMLFPRDLNAFFDRFSHAMPQPYTRSQLSEKLRRLRKKFRIASSRILRGMDPSAFSGHDRELYDLSSRLWDPSFADSSPFGASGPDASKRRKRLPPPPLLLSRFPSDHSKPVPPGDSPSPAPATASSSDSGRVNGEKCRGVEEKSGNAGRDASGAGGPIKLAVMRALLDVFESAVKEVKSSMVERDGFEKRWEEQRILELNVLAGRLRLGIEDALQE